MTTPLTEEQRDLVESVRGLLAKHVDTASRSPSSSAVSARP